MKTQIATDREQSKRLLACGVKPETADMCYSGGALSLMEYLYEIKDRESRREDYEIIPAWSISRLLDLLPKEINDKGLQTNLSLNANPEGLWWSIDYYDYYMDGRIVYTEATDPIEACVRTIIWLTSQNYSLNNIEQ